MLIKHTAVIVPGVFLLFAIYYWIWRPWRGGVTWPQWRTTLGPRATTLVRAVLIGLVAMWILLGFDYSVPARQFNDVTLSPTSRIGEIVDGSLQLRWPCGTYIGCFVSGLLVNDFGQPALIYGHISDRGWPWYFPVLMTLKTPLGIWLVMLLALASLWRVRLRPGEISIIIPLLAWVAFFTLARVNYGFRHFLPGYAFMLMWAGRCVADGIAATMRRRLMVIACCAVAIAAVDSVWWHPNYLSYVNFPRDRVWMQMTDSNIDWGQSMRQIARWLDAHPPPGGKTVHVVTRTTWAGYDGRYWLGDRVHFIERGQTPPSDGILIISPIWVCGVYDAPDYKPYAFLRGATPVDMIGESTLVYDLDQIHR
jgi:hypothetical protein